MIDTEQQLTDEEMVKCVNYAFIIAEGELVDRPAGVAVATRSLLSEDLWRVHIPYVDPEMTTDLLLRGIAGRFDLTDIVLSHFRELRDIVNQRLVGRVAYSTPVQGVGRELFVSYIAEMKENVEQFAISGDNISAIYMHEDTFGRQGN